MIKRILTVFLILGFLGFALPALARVDNSARNRIENTNRVETKNKQEDYALQVEERHEEENQEEKEDIEEDSEGIFPIPRSQTAREHMSAVAQKAEELLSQQAQKEGGIGEQIREVAQSQNQIRERVEEQFKKLEKRKGLLRNLLGPNRLALKNLDQQIEENENQIEKLQKIKEQALSLTEKNAIEEMIESLLAANTALEEKIAQEKKAPGILGRILNFFSIGNFQTED